MKTKLPFSAGHELRAGLHALELLVEIQPPQQERQRRAHVFRLFDGRLHHPVFRRHKKNHTFSIGQKQLAFGGFVLPAHAPRLAEVERALLAARGTPALAKGLLEVRPHTLEPIVLILDAAQDVSQIGRSLTAPQRRPQEGIEDWPACGLAAGPVTASRRRPSRPSVCLNRKQHIGLVIDLSKDSTALLGLTDLRCRVPRCRCRSADSQSMDATLERIESLFFVFC